jgi:hypothetical protein
MVPPSESEEEEEEESEEEEEEDDFSVASDASLPLSVEIGGSRAKPHKKPKKTKELPRGLVPVDMDQEIKIAQYFEGQPMFWDNTHPHYNKRDIKRASLADFARTVDLLREYELSIMNYELCMKYELCEEFPVKLCTGFYVFMYVCTYV